MTTTELATGTPLLPEYLAPVTLNPAYALSIDNRVGSPTYGSSHTHVHGRQILALQVPGGFWAVKVRPRGDGWAAFAVPRRGTVGQPFDLATGTTKESVLVAAIGWYDCASSAVMRMDRLVFAGTGNATEETPLDGGEQQ